MKKMNAGWLIGLMAMGILGPPVVRAEEAVAPVPTDAGPVETGITLAQANTATGSQNFAMQGNLAVAAAMAFVAPRPPAPPAVPPPLTDIEQQMHDAAYPFDMPLGPVDPTIEHPFHPGPKDFELEDRLEQIRIDGQKDGEEFMRKYREQKGIPNLEIA